MRKPSSPITASHTVSPMWPRYGHLLVVVDGNWMLCGSRQNQNVLVETRSLDAWLNSSTVLWMERETSLSNLRCLVAYPFIGKASGENPEDKFSLGPVKTLLCFQERKGLIPEAKGEVTLTETLSAEVGAL